MGQIAIPEGARVCLDSSVLIYFVEDIQPFASLLTPVFRDGEQGRILVFTSALTLLEVLVRPLQSGDESLAQYYRGLLTGAERLQKIEISDSVLEEAARLRASLRIKTPDAIHAASARVAGCDFLITNDDHLRVVPDVSTIVLSDVA